MMWYFMTGLGLALQARFISLPILNQKMYLAEVGIAKLGKLDYALIPLPPSRFEWIGLRKELSVVLMNLLLWPIYWFGFMSMLLHTERALVKIERMQQAAMMTREEALRLADAIDQLIKEIEQRKGR